MEDGEEARGGMVTSSKLMVVYLLHGTIVLFGNAGVATENVQLRTRKNCFEDLSGTWCACFSKKADPENGLDHALELHAIYWVFRALASRIFNQTAM